MPQREGHKQRKQEPTSNRTEGAFSYSWGQGAPSSNGTEERHDVGSVNRISLRHVRMSPQVDSRQGLNTSAQRKDRRRSAGRREETRETGKAGQADGAALWTGGSRVAQPAWAQEQQGWHGGLPLTGARSTRGQACGSHSGFFLIPGRHVLRAGKRASADWRLAG